MYGLSEEIQSLRRERDRLEKKERLLRGRIEAVHQTLNEHDAPTHDHKGGALNINGRLVDHLAKLKGFEDDIDTAWLAFDDLSKANTVAAQTAAYVRLSNAMADLAKRSSHFNVNTKRIELPDEEEL